MSLFFLSIVITKFRARVKYSILIDFLITTKEFSELECSKFCDHYIIDI